MAGTKKFLSRNTCSWKPGGLKAWVRGSIQITCSD